jgi:Lrp/AsnC family transcriptional regulator, regulator for asnA, asnC and gidA
VSPDGQLDTQPARARARNGKAHRLDELDAKLIGLLQFDGRQPNTELARRLNVAEATIRNRIGRLLKDRVIQVGAVADPLRIGYQAWVFIEIQVHLPEIDRVTEQLARFPEIIFLGICTGDCDLVATGLFRSNAHMDEFFTKRLSKVRGIQRTSTLSILRVVKREYAYPIQIEFSGVDGVDGLVRPGLRRAAAKSRKSPRWAGSLPLSRGSG